MNLGDRVRMADADEPRSIPAYRSLIGTVVAVNAHGDIMVRWDVDRQPDVMWRKPATVKAAVPEGEVEP